MENKKKSEKTQIEGKQQKKTNKRTNIHLITTQNSLQHFD